MEVQIHCYTNRQIVHRDCSSNFPCAWSLCGIATTARARACEGMC
jgi:hypothetical protein